jgi:hypothetical protein
MDVTAAESLIVPRVHVAGSLSVHVLDSVSPPSLDAHI